MGLLDYFWGARKKTKANVKKEVSGKCQELLQWSGYWNQLVDAGNRPCFLISLPSWYKR